MRMSSVSAGLTVTRLTRPLVLLLLPLPPLVPSPFSIGDEDEDEGAVCSQADALVTGSVDPQSQSPSAPACSGGGGARDGIEGGGGDEISDIFDISDSSDLPVDELAVLVFVLVIVSPVSVSS